MPSVVRCCRVKGWGQGAGWKICSSVKNGKRIGRLRTKEENGNMIGSGAEGLGGSKSSSKGCMMMVHWKL